MPDALQPGERGRLRGAATELARADYHLGCALRDLADTKRVAWAADARILMNRCIRLRRIVEAKADSE
jgi:hypothetical protein